ncbi:MT-A70 family [Aspergillus stella-maris]|uniref:MT-A70 family n=1 Tax=Aspergillus stella-maris TaxID=1810926 RepID=UPI003CCD8519
MTPNSSILYQNASDTVFLIDIPTSIALAQELAQEPQPQSTPNSNGNTKTSTTTCPTKHTHKRRRSYSTEPRKEPYPTPPEPKTPAKRGKLLARIPLSERELYDELAPILFDALADIKARFRSDSGSSNEWCFPRLTLPDPEAGENGNGPDSTASGRDATGTTQKSQNTQPKWVLSNLRPERRKRLTKTPEDRNRKKKKNPASVNQPSYNNDNDDQEEKGAKHQFHTAYFGLQNSQRGLGLAFDEYDKTQNLVQPPLILAPGRNIFVDEGEIINTVVKNTSRETATVDARRFFSVKAFRERGLSLDPDLDLDVDADAGAGADVDALGVAYAQAQDQVFYIPPLATFILTTLPLCPSALLQEYGNTTPIPHLSPDQKFNLILLDPPWSNKSVTRSGHYKTQAYSDTELLTEYMFSVLAVHAYQPGSCTPGNDSGNGDQVGNQSDISIAAIWTTNSVKSREAAYTALATAGFVVIEQWIWVKTTLDGRPLTPIDGLWRKPYEVLIIGQRKREGELGTDRTVKRKIIAAVPDVHSRKPNLKEVFERVFFTRQTQIVDGATAAATGTADGSLQIQYSALEVFARNLTVGWCAVGDEALKFNAEGWWADDEEG